jgi:hypothetical protein
VKRTKPFAHQQEALRAEIQTRRAYFLLLDARDALVEARNVKTLARVRLAISSIKGALRNASHRAMDRRFSGDSK